MNPVTNEIVFENEYLVVVIKNPGELSTPSRMGKQDVRSVLGLRLQQQLKTTLFPVHRLDFEVGGLILFAKSSKAHTAAQKWFEQKTVQKTYRAWSSEKSFRNWPSTLHKEETDLILQPGNSWQWSSKILRGKKRSFVSPHGDLAETQVQFIGERIIGEQKILEWDLQPQTGRSHQLRLEMAQHGFPICADRLYGSSLQTVPHDKIFLWAFALDLKKIPMTERWGLPEKLEINIPFTKWELRTLY